MAHMFDTGFSVREVPWHGLGNVPDEYPGSWAQARTLAGLDWDPIEVPLYEEVPVGDTGVTAMMPIDDFKQIKRSDTLARLAVAGDGYQLITHDVFGEVFEHILDASDGEVQYETAGSLDGGRKVWALARLGEQRHLNGDPSPLQPYLALLTSHDGKAALRVIDTCVRIVCMNTWHAADIDSTQRGSSYSFKHTKNWRVRLEDAKNALTTSRAQIENTIAEAEGMLRERVTAAQARWFIREFAVHRTIRNTVGKRAATKRELKARLDQPRVAASVEFTTAKLTELMDSVTTQGIRGTVYGLVQAAGEFSDHYRETKSQETLLARTMFADSEPLKLAAVRLARQAVTQ
jgi:phage/plasmid-like protein (TIGR03299 family)